MIFQRKAIELIHPDYFGFIVHFLFTKIVSLINEISMARKSNYGQVDS